MGDFEKFGNTVDNAFYFVVDKIISLQDFFWDKAWGIGYVVLLIAILSTALNYALTGQGLKENIVKIVKATIFFLIVMLAYPRIISFMTSWTFNLAEQSISPSVTAHYNTIIEEFGNDLPEPPKRYNPQNPRHRAEFSKSVKQKAAMENLKLFSNITHNRSTPQMDYTTVSPAAVLKIIFFIAGECITFADDNSGVFGEFSRVLKGLVCAFLAIITGVFALLEYLICFLEFMLVASVGIILFPLSLWEGSKFMSEKFIGAILGFFMKLLLCNLAIFLMLYGFVSIFSTISGNGFFGSPEQIIFIVFSCLQFFYICKSAPGIAQSLLTGTPSLSATGAISAATGAIAAAGATMSMGKMFAGGMTKIGSGVGGSIMEATAASNAVKDAGGTSKQQRGAFLSSIMSDAGDALNTKGLGLARSLLSSSSGGSSSGGGGMNPHSWRDTFLQGKNKDTGEIYKLEEISQQRMQEGAKRGRAYLGLPEPEENKQKENNAGNA
jgi:hypothetical protein